MIIVNFSTPQFAKGQKRLSESLNGHPHLLYTNYQQIKSPSHDQSPYQFKIHAIEQAFKLDNVVLWCDASMYLVGDLSKIENIILQDGYFMEEAGHYVRDWCNGNARNYFKLTPDEDGFTMFSAGLLGLNANSPIAMEFFTQWKASAKAGCFKGHWRDHRHDMTCASIIAQRLDMKYQKGGSHMSYIGEVFGPPNPESVFHLLGIS